MACACKEVPINNNGPISLSGSGSGSGSGGTGAGVGGEADSTSSGDDVWDDDEFITTGDIKRIHVKQGYLDGLSKAKESSLQDGFDDGYPLGANFAIRVGQILSKLTNDSELFQTAKKELNLTKILQRSYFDENLDLNESDHPVLKKWDQIIAQSQTAQPN